jgi:putative acetyltransferase
MSLRVISKGADCATMLPGGHGAAPRRVWAKPLSAARRVFGHAAALDSLSDLTPMAEPPPLTIRRAARHDAAAFARIMGHPVVAAQLLQLPHQNSEQWEARLAEAPKPGMPDLILVAERDGEVLGNAGLHTSSAALRRRHVANLGLVVAPQAQGQGVGNALMLALLDYADRWALLLRIELTVYADNARAIALYRRHGFAVEGTHRAYALRDGVFVDALAMARLHPQPPQLP